MHTYAFTVKMDISNWYILLVAISSNERGIRNRTGGGLNGPYTHGSVRKRLTLCLMGQSTTNVSQSESLAVRGSADIGPFSAVSTPPSSF